MKEKDLIGIPWRVAFALQDDGWILRSDVIWAKKNPMPESVTDRPTKAHEYVFLFAKSPRYWYDAEAIREPAIKGSANAGPRNYVAGSIGNQRKFLSQTEQSVEDGRNARTVWTIPTRGNSLAHFAMMPPELARRCIVSGCPKGGIVFDPFMGGGTTAIEARKAGRHYIGSELNPEYAAMARNRLALGDETTKAIDRGEPTTLPLPFEGM
ncbi:MAG: site-specific DNA-methyltransferase [Burkholderia vietnamiensis]|nr:site-specific DNA-methyltransferase [Burkholderia vietnamiensis]